MVVEQAAPGLASWHEHNEITVKPSSTSQTPPQRLAKGREEATLEKVGGVETWFGRETNHGREGEEGAMATEKGKRQTTTQGSAWGKEPPQQLAGKARGA